VTLTASHKAREALAGRPASQLLSLIAEGDYFALLAYLPSAPNADLDIPGESLTFGTLAQAQALGDFASRSRVRWSVRLQ